MEKIPYGVYSKELREEAIKMVKEGGLKVSEVSRIMSIPKSTIAYWIKADKKGKLSEMGSSKEGLSEKELEIARLKKELAQAKMECEFLKKAAAYFAKESQ